MTERGPWCTRHKDFLAAIGVLAAVVTLGFGAYQILIRDDNSGGGAAPDRASDDPPDDVLEEIAQRRIWAEVPITFPATSDALEAQ